MMYSYFIIKNVLFFFFYKKIRIYLFISLKDGGITILTAMFLQREFLHGVQLNLNIDLKMNIFYRGFLRFLFPFLVRCIFS